jgi:hypothetical protein
MKLTTHLHLLQRSRVRGAVSPIPNSPPWRDAQFKKPKMYSQYLKGPQVGCSSSGLLKSLQSFYGPHKEAWGGKFFHICTASLLFLHFVGSV